MSEGHLIRPLFVRRELLVLMEHNASSGKTQVHIWGDQEPLGSRRHCQGEEEEGEEEERHQFDDKSQCKSSKPLLGMMGHHTHLLKMHRAVHQHEEEEKEKNKRRRKGRGDN